MRHAVAGVVGLAFLAGGASAQPFIEIGWIESRAVAGGASSSYGYAVFDASAPPDSVDGSQVIFNALVARQVRAFSGTDPGDVDGPFSVTSGSLRYDVSNNWYSVSIASDGLLVPSPLAGFSASMTSLPDDPASYYSAGGPFIAVGSANWTPDFGFSNGTFNYWIIEVEDPIVPEPCPGDCDGNGTLNLDDIDCFVASFLGGCP